MTMTQQQEIHPTIYISPMTAASPQNMKQQQQQQPAVVKHFVPHPLTIDCIEEVLNHLLDSSGSLYSCALVNSVWSKLAIPLLWYHPFGNRLNGKKARILFESYISCFPDDKKNKLATKKIHFQRFRPLFNYPKYLRGFDWDNFQYAIDEWFSTSMPQLLDHDHDIKLQFSKVSIASYLLSRCNGLRILKIDQDTSTNDNNLLTTFPNFRFIFSKLEKLEIQFNSASDNWAQSIEMISLLATKLSVCSRNIQHISITDKNTSTSKIPLQFPQYICEALWKLIKVQSNLLTLDIHEFWNPKKSELFYNTLESQAHSLKYLSISHISQFHLLLPTLNSCTNLETLVFQTVPETNMETLLYADDSTSQLSIKKLLCYDINGNPKTHSLTLGIIILMTNQHLRELYLPMEISSELLLDVICRYCPNLVNLHLVLSTSLLLKILPYISTLPLISLALIDKDNSSFPIELVQQIAQSFPSTLCNLEINFHMTSQGLQYFLGNCRGLLKSLIIHNKFMNDQYLAVVAHYAKTKKTLKKFSSDCEFSEEMLENARIWIPKVENIEINSSSSITHSKNR